MIRIATTEELFREAAERTLGADGFGFAVANQVETQLLGAGGGGKLIGVPGDAGLSAGRLITLTEGAVRIAGHVEELFDVALYVVAPGGGQDVLRFYCGPSGLALGAGHQLARPRTPCSPAELARVEQQATPVARAWAAALEKIPAADFEISAGSDFGELTIGVAGGVAIGNDNPRRAAPHRSPWDAAWLAQAQAQAQAAVEAIEAAHAGGRGGGADVGEVAASAIREMRVACTLAGLADGSQLRLEAVNDAFEEACAPLWPRAWTWFVAALEAIPADAIGLPPLVEHLQGVLPFPPTRELMDELGGRDRLWREHARASAIRARRWRVHPWT